MLKRAHHLRELQSSLRQFPAVALLGPRQVGKTTLARALSGKTKSVFLDLERQSDRSKLIDPEAFFKDHTKELIIIDEVQHIPELFTHLRPAIDEHRQPGRFLLLGSASPALVKGVSESLAGRIRYLELSPITLAEAEKNNIDFNKLWVRGGFPLSLTASNNLSSLTWRQQLIYSFVERDLSLLFGVSISGNTVRNFWQMLAHQQGSLFNAQALGLSLGVSGVTVRRYLDFLEAAYLVRILQPWFVNASKRLVKSPKVYIRDSGLLHAFLNLPDKDSLLGHPVAGFSWEGFVIEQIIYSMPNDVSAFFYRTHHGAEADLVLVRGVTPIAAIEIKLTNAPIVSRGFYQAIEDLSVDKGFLITPSSDTYSQRNVRVTNVRHFIEKTLPAL
jgi:predicted AAA+ superfamily ATPase